MTKMPHSRGDKMDLSWAPFWLSNYAKSAAFGGTITRAIDNQPYLQYPLSRGVRGVRGHCKTPSSIFHLLYTGPGLARALSWLPARLPAPPEDVDQPVEALALAQPFYLGHCVLLALAAGYAGQNRVPDHLAPAELDPEAVARPPEAPPPALQVLDRLPATQAFLPLAPGILDRKDLGEAGDNRRRFSDWHWPWQRAWQRARQQA